MALYVRVYSSFYSHRKTVRLRAALGNDALWIPPRLWSYAADNQPDGVFEGYSAGEIALLIGYSGDAPSMLQALLQAGFLDPEPLRIHDWEEHNGYHSDFSERARNAALARWGKEEKKGEDKKGKDIDTSIASSMPQASELAKEIYALYPLKVGKPTALKAIVKALKGYTSDFLRERTHAYANAVSGTDTMIPHPSTWFNQERFNDDPKTWVRANGKPAIIANHEEGF